MTSRSLSDCRVLIVDDTKANIDVLVETLREHYKISVATDGARALRAEVGHYPSKRWKDRTMRALLVARSVRCVPSAGR